VDVAYWVGERLFWIGLGAFATLTWLWARDVVDEDAAFKAGYAQRDAQQKAKDSERATKASLTRKARKEAETHAEPAQ
jgi:hypothetical protein